MPLQLFAIFIFTRPKNHHPKHHNSPSKRHKLTTNYHPESHKNPRKNTI